LQFFKDPNINGTLDSGESVQYVTVTAVASSAVQTANSLPISGTFATTAGGLSQGAWVKVQVQDSAAASTVLNSSQMVLVSIPTGLTLAAVGSSTVNQAGPSTYGISTSSTTGAYYLNFTAASAGTYVLSTSIAGSSSTAATTSLTFASAAVSATTAGALTNLAGTSVSRCVCSKRRLS